MADLDAQLHLVHGVDADDFDVYVGLEVARVFRVGDEDQHLVAQDLYVLKGRFEVDENGELFAHGARAGDVLDGKGVEDVVGVLYLAVRIDAPEDSKEEGNVLDDELGA